MGDLTSLRCDAWLLPADLRGQVTRAWWSKLTPEVQDDLRHFGNGQRDVPTGWGYDGARVTPIPSSLNAPGRPAIYLGIIGGPGRDAGWYVEAARQFVAAVDPATSDVVRSTRRTKPLAALPLVGSGVGGGRLRAGGIAAELVPALYDLAAEHDLDVALVLDRESTFAAAQNARAALLKDRDQASAPASWGNLTADALAQGRRLATKARERKLALFLGAGVSDGAGLPGWTRLLDLLAEDVESLSSDEKDALNRISSLDRARLIQKKLGARSKLGEKIRQHLGTPYYSLTHGLLASLPVAEVATTNYDCLFEHASNAVKNPVAVLPYDAVGERSRWLVKLHGCVNHPSDIVLTREDYLRYRDGRSALIGIVQAMLVTRHSLFVGFSLNDDFFHQIVDDVRRTFETRASRSVRDCFGTVLQLGRNPTWESLWQDELRFVDFGTSPSDAEAKRKVEIFLDYLLFQATDVTLPILDPAYAALLGRGEEKLRNRLLDLCELEQDSDVLQTTSWQLLARTLKRFKGDYDGVPPKARRTTQRRS